MTIAIAVGLRLELINAYNSGPDIIETMNAEHSWIVDIDLAKFVGTVDDHDKMMPILGQTIKDGDVVSVVRNFLVSGVIIDDEYEETIVGIPRERQHFVAISGHRAR